MQYPLSSITRPLFLLKKLLQHKAVQLLPLIFLISENAQGNAQENYQACLYEVQNCKMNHDSNLLSDRDSCNHKKERETIICEAVYGD